MKVITLGNGFVSNHLPYEKIEDRIPYDSFQIKKLLASTGADVIVNCIGKTGRPNVDWCELNKAETFLSNVTLPSLIAAECQKLGIHMIHIGSGCIYFGQSPNYWLRREGRDNPYLDETCERVDSGWKEDDFANPKSYYSKTKYACDLLLGQMENVTTLRIRMPVSPKNDARNFINKVRNYSQVIDIPNSMTLMDDLVRCVDWFANKPLPGIFHVVNPEPMSAAQVMREYQKYVPDHKFAVIDENELDKLTVAKRSNCILDNSKLASAGFKMTSSKEGLEACMAAYIKNF